LYYSYRQYFLLTLSIATLCWGDSGSLLIFGLHAVDLDFWVWGGASILRSVVTSEELIALPSIHFVESEMTCVDSEVGGDD
jgi:hypothetical protein